MLMRHIVICGLTNSITSSHIFLQTVRFSERKILEREMCLLIGAENLFEIFIFVRIIKRDVINVFRSLCTVPVYVQYRLMYSTGFSFQVLMKIEFSRQIFDSSKSVQW